jgi:arylsulfatase A-like enzyme
VVRNVSLLDIAPTLLVLAGASPERHYEGRSLVPLLGEEPKMLVPDAPQSPLLAQLLPFPGAGGSNGNRLHGSAIIEGTRKGLLGTTGAIEVYDLAADPGERYPLPPLTAIDASDLLATFDQMQTELAERTEGTGLARPLDDATKEQLRALGYHQ